MNNNKPDKLLSKSQVAEMYSVSQRTVDRLAACGKLPRVKIAGCVRFRLKDVLKLVEAS
ncbi:helix-turn-helix domain-containing protein [Opitutales bacterium]|nr:helix-turn-helix domain-containing protein [Opitutales bacterium]